MTATQLSLDLDNDEDATASDNALTERLDLLHIGVDAELSTRALDILDQHKDLPEDRLAVLRYSLWLEERPDITGAERHEWLVSLGGGPGADAPPDFDPGVSGWTAAAENELVCYLTAGRTVTRTGPNRRMEIMRYAADAFHKAHHLCSQTVAYKRICDIMLCEAPWLHTPNSDGEINMWRQSEHDEMSRNRVIADQEFLRALEKLKLIGLEPLEPIFEDGSEDVPWP